MDIGVVGAGGTTGAAKASPILGKDDFLKMLIMQLRYQDPLEPMKGTEFATQLAQFSSVEQLSNMNTNLLGSLEATSVLAQSISNALAATFIGKEVRAGVSTFHWGGAEDVTIGYTLPADAPDVTITVYNETGDIVKTLNAPGGKSGDNTVTWDGTNNEGQIVSSGKYRFVVTAKDAAGGAINASPFISGRVEGVRYKSEGTFFVIDGVEVALSDILEIRQG